MSSLSRVSQPIIVVLCLVAVAEAADGGSSWAIHAAVVSEHGARSGWVLFDQGGIKSVFCPEDAIPAGATRFEFDGYLFPGLIDTHNHAPWNVIPQWRAGRQFENRYGWIDDDAYRREVNGVFYERIRNAQLEPVALKYAEVRALVGGTTLLQSTYREVEPEFLVRNLDSSYAADSRIPDISQASQVEFERFRGGLASGKTRRIFLHIAEGRANDRRCAAEFGFLRFAGLVRPGVVVIHGIALTRREFAEMAESGMYLVWSPKSNQVLYGETVDIEEALKAGVTVALAPDWTITGSDSLLEELAVARAYSQEALAGRITPRQLFKMATCDAARVAGVSERLGRIAFGFAADMFLTPRLDHDPFESLLKTTPRDIQLVFINGSPVYGDRQIMRQWLPADALDDVRVEGVKKALHLVGAPGEDEPLRFREIEATLRKALPRLAPLVEDNR